jgi:hypothetical protein
MKTSSRERALFCQQPRADARSTEFTPFKTTPRAARERFGTERNEFRSTGPAAHRSRSSRPEPDALMGWQLMATQILCQPQNVNVAYFQRALIGVAIDRFHETSARQTSSTGNIHLFDAISSSTASITLPKPPWGAGEPAAGARQGAVISLRARPGYRALVPLCRMGSVPLWRAG